MARSHPGDRVAHPGSRVAGRDAVEGYLAVLATHLAGLGGPPRAREAILAELRDGLLEAVAVRLDEGLSPAQAARAALEELGDAATVAAAFAPELAAVQARRTALTLVRTGPLVGMLWIAALAATHAPPWRHDLAGVRLAFPLLGLAIATAGLGTLLAVAATGPPSRWLAPRPRLAPTAAATVAIAAVVADLTLLGTLAGEAVTAPGTVADLTSLAGVPVALALLASLTRLALSGRATRRTLAARAALT